MFGGKFGADITCPRRAMVYDLDVYSDLWKKASVRHWTRIIDGIQDEVIRRIVFSVPDLWVSGKTRLHILDQLRTRRLLLPRLLEDAENVARTGHSIQYHRTRNATQPGQICAAPIISQYSS